MNYLSSLKEATLAERAPKKKTAPAKPQKENKSLKPLVTRVVSDGVRVGIQARHVHWLNPAWKSKGAWFQPRRMWVFSASNGNEIVDTLKAVEQAGCPKGLFFDPKRVAINALNAMSNPDPDFFASEMGIRLFPLLDGGVAVSSTYDKPTIRALMSYDRDWDGANRLWILEDADVKDVCQSLELIAAIKPCFVYIHHEALDLEVVRDSLDEKVTFDLGNAAFGEKENNFAGGGGKGPAVGDGMVQTSFTKNREITDEEMEVIRKKYSLMPHQVSGVKFLAERSSALCGDDMGMGKSRQTIVAAQMVRDGKAVLIVSPATAKLNLRNEVHKVIGEDARVQVISSSADILDTTAEWVVVNFELMGAVRDDASHFGAMLIDEAHYCKAGNTQRALNCSVMAAKIPNVYLLSGTPVVNREEELYHLMRISGHPIGALSKAMFNQRYAGSSELRAELNREVTDWMIRRNKETELKGDMPPKRVKFVEIEPPRDLMHAYDEVTKSSSDTLVLQKLTRWRMVAESMKIDFVLEKVQKRRPRDKFIIFCEFLETVDDICEALEESKIKFESLVGSDSATERDAAEKRFESDKKITVFVTTTKAGGESINLVSANCVLFAGMPWSYAKRTQAEDRAWRIGQKRPVNVLIPWVAGTTDVHQMKTIEHKEMIGNEILATDATNSTTEVAGDVVADMPKDVADAVEEALAQVGSEKALDDALDGDVSITEKAA